MTIIEKAAEKLFEELERGGAIASIEDRYCEKLESEEVIKQAIGNYLKGFLFAHWPNVQLIELQLPERVGEGLNGKV